MSDPLAELSAAVGADDWLGTAVIQVRNHPDQILRLFPAASRHMGRDVLPSTGRSVDEAGRIILLAALGDQLERHLPDLYRFGDNAERLAILNAINVLPPRPAFLELTTDALRSNDPRMVSAALGPFALRHLSDTELAQAVTKCVFMEVPLPSVEQLGSRTTAHLSRMLAELVLERVVAGRRTPADVWPLINEFPPADVLAAIAQEATSAHLERRQAATTALNARALSNGQA